VRDLRDTMIAGIALGHHAALIVVRLSRWSTTPGSFAHFFIVRIVPKRSRRSSAVTNVRSMSGGGKEPICGIALWQREQLGDQHDLVGERRLAHGRGRGDQPFGQVGGQPNLALGIQQECLPG
jgi:hypothetical protein